MRKRHVFTGRVCRGGARRSIEGGIRLVVFLACLRLARAAGEFAMVRSVLIWGCWRLYDRISTVTCYSTIN
jgi:hypothetical protein